MSMNPDSSIKERVHLLVSRMTLEEKISQTMHDSPAIPRLGIPEYNWWNECLHGVARAGVATVFPQAIGMAASFNKQLVYKVASAISDEARAKHHEAVLMGNRESYFGLTFWSPNINIFRDPRWGRGQETYGEDPYLSARLGVEFVKGLQGDDPRYLKTVATPKHFAAHSGPEPQRHGFDAKVSQRDLRETYLPAFKACIREGKAASIMGAYNRTNGQPCCASTTLLEDILRKEWGFKGYVVSDCGAISDIHKNHKVTGTAAESAALAVKAGCDLNCGEIYGALLDAVEKGLISEEAIDESVERLFTARFRLGMFDPPVDVKYTQISPEIVECEKHRDLARQIARESIVLLKNDNNLLPLNKNLNSVAVIGPHAASQIVLLGNYYGYSSRLVTAFEGIVGAVSPGTQIAYAEGCNIQEEKSSDYDNAILLASQSDVVIAVMGCSPELEGEEGDVADSDGGGDRPSIDLPNIQIELLKQLHQTGTPVVLVLMGGSPIAINWAAENIPAILMAWYPGEEGGNAIADILFGEVNPGGRLPITFVKSLDQLPDFEDYNMKGRTYRFMKAEPLYRFGYGLSYTTFEYSNIQLDKSMIHSDEQLTIEVDVENRGDRPGDEVVQLYVTDLQASVPVPMRHLEGFERIHLSPSEKRKVRFRLDPEQLMLYRDDGKPFLEAGDFEISIGGGQPNDPSSGSVSATFALAHH